MRDIEKRMFEGVREALQLGPTNGRFRPEQPDANAATALVLQALSIVDGEPAAAHYWEDAADFWMQQMDKDKETT